MQMRFKFLFTAMLSNFSYHKSKAANRYLSLQMARSPISTINLVEGLRMSLHTSIESTINPSMPKWSVSPPVDYKNFGFEITKTDPLSKARLATITTPHGKVDCPNFVFCGTKAAMKGVTTQQLRDEGSQIMLSNTYHLLLTPGPEVVAKLGGLQRMTGWNGPMLTDSGGYQIFSMGHGSVSSEIKGRRNEGSVGWNQTLLSVTEKGATFRSYVDGSEHTLTPESSISCQKQLGADLLVVLDECTPFNVDKSYTEASMHRSHRWAERSLKEFLRLGCVGSHGLYGIVQGGVYDDLREASCSYINSMPVFGTAIGGSLGATRKDMHAIVAFTRSRVRDDRPCHLLGIGGVRDIFHGVRLGVDTFDCVHPTRLGRHGGALVTAAHWEEEQLEEDYSPNVQEINRAKKLERKALERARHATIRGEVLSAASTNISALPIRRRKAASQRVVREHIHLDKSSMRLDTRPIDPTCGCYTCKNFSRGYLHHLFRAKESTGGTLVSIHNIHFMNRLMADIRRGIAEGSLDNIEQKYVHPDLVAADMNEQLVNGTEDATMEELQQL